MKLVLPKELFPPGRKTLMEVIRLSKFMQLTRLKKLIVTSHEIPPSLRLYNQSVNHFLGRGDSSGS